MAYSTETYQSHDLRKRFHAQAIRVWIITLAVVTIWLGSTLIAPILDSTPIYTFFSYVCHQMADRSFYLAGHPIAVCSRCFGIYAGLLVGVLVYPLWRPIDESEPIPRLWLFLSLVPVSIDWSLTMFGIWENTHLSRFVTGLILGAACATFIVPALVDIIRNFTGRRRRLT
ncbi:MAG TPA: DUF2085 domain-containing protein [Pyrinomonadaceae bacterium]|nr:DUF2085 domain-containing protein [Pyrinomonadaceae bacterium]